MSEGAGNDDADGGSRSLAPYAAEQRRRSVPGQQDDRWALDERGVWRQRRGTTRSGPPRWRAKLGPPGPFALAVAGVAAAVGVIGLATVLILGQAGVFGSNTAAAVPGFHPTATKPAQADRNASAVWRAAWAGLVAVGWKPGTAAAVFEPKTPA
jgi:peptidoglycan hydrolase-like protein with peptidoglycan-binding domain